ncbi:NTP transferase domain-containing protein [Novosphingobium aquimarinum]|uniref:NTP transferase domain-containing protein n=1 Tax=Novosphingobium aquimarinum TaxID=2682494 RepID=UPI0018DB900F|nr:NTP transferase domain-containing protein [Novosphingobium aquimarinum]
MGETRVLIAAAGAGSRAGLPYPKTLHPVEGRPILGRILDLLAVLDPEPTIVASPAGRPLVAQFLEAEGRSAHLLTQPSPTGMGDAVLHFDQSPAAIGAGTVVLIWGDIPYLSRATLDATLAHHRTSGAVLTFPSRHVDRAYTVISRDADGRVTGLEETRVTGRALEPGERDIGVFVFEAGPVLDALRTSASRHDPSSGEHGFLQVIARLAERGDRVDALPIATQRELISLNALSDLETQA